MTAQMVTYRLGCVTFLHGGCFDCNAMLTLEFILKFTPYPPHLPREDTTRLGQRCSGYTKPRRVSYKRRLRNKHFQHTGVILPRPIADTRGLSSITPPAPLLQRHGQRQYTAPTWSRSHPQISAMPDGGGGGCPEGPALTRTRSFKPAPFPRPSRAWPSYIFTAKGSSLSRTSPPLPNIL